jgi:protein-S-isoprenylcysteine O-methyltransferase Ste14
MPLARVWQRLGGAAGHVFFRTRDVLAPVAVLLLVVSARRGDFLASPSIDRWLDGLGVLAVVVGLTIRSLVMATSAVRRSGVHKRVVAPTLFDTGPYAWCRNPLYVGNAIILIGLSLIFDSRWMVGLALPAALLAIRSVVAAEERVLMEDFGVVYRDYCRRVPRFVPRLPFPRQAAVAIDWRRALRKEHGTAFAAVTTALVLRATEDLARMGSAAWHWHEPVILVAWLVTVALWAVARHLKRTGRLNDMSPPAPIASASDALPGDVAA